MTCADCCGVGLSKLGDALSPPSAATRTADGWWVPQGLHPRLRHNLINVGKWGANKGTENHGRGTRPLALCVIASSPWEAPACRSGTLSSIYKPGNGSANTRAHPCPHVARKWQSLERN